MSTSVHTKRARYQEQPEAKRVCYRSAYLYLTKLYRYMRVIMIMCYIVVLVQVMLSQFAQDEIETCVRVS